MTGVPCWDVTNTISGVLGESLVSYSELMLPEEGPHTLISAITGAPHTVYTIPAGVGDVLLSMTVDFNTSSGFIKAVINAYTATDALVATGIVVQVGASGPTTSTISVAELPATAVYWEFGYITTWTVFEPHDVTFHVAYSCTPLMAIPAKLATIVG